MTKQQRNFKYRNLLLKTPTESEVIFKNRLDSLNINYIFQKGFIKGDYHCIVDFYLPKPKKICIEIDGSIHDTLEQKKKDSQKDSYLNSRGFKVIRIKNSDVLLYDLKNINSF